MVVHAVKGKAVTCDWFEGKKLHRKSFHIDQLEFPLIEELSDAELDDLIEQRREALEAPRAKTGQTR
jgi:hypothetical protein